MKKRLTAGLLCVMLFLSACAQNPFSTQQNQGNEAEEATERASETQDTAVDEMSSAEAESGLTGETEGLYLLTGIDTGDGLLNLRAVSDGAFASASYSGATIFYDKYGTMTSLSNFAPGDVVTLDFSVQGRLSGVQQSDRVWIYRDVTDYQLDLDRMVFTYRDSNYRVTGDTPVYVGNQDKGLRSVGDGDSLNVTGLGKDVLSMTITTGNGTIELINIGVFLGGWLNLDNTTYLEISDGMKISAAEGTHVLTVANDGWGDSTVVAVKRGQSVAVDLNALKGEGPKYCELTVAPDIESAVVYLDNQKKEANEPLSVRYGVHLLTVAADGYDVWQRRLVVNSKTATIDVLMTKSGGSSSGTSAGGASENSAAQAAEAAESGAQTGLAGSLAGSQTGVGTGSEQRQAEQAAAETALETLTGMLDTLTGTSLNSSDE